MGCHAQSFAQGQSSLEAPRSESSEEKATEDTTAVDSKVTTMEIDEDTPVSHEEIIGEKNLTSHRSWRPPNYENQESAIGYSADAFAVPKGLEIPVKFWIDVYSKYTTDQGVLHDSENIDLVYKEIDFTPISTRADLNIYQKEAMKIRMVTTEKKNVIAMLTRFQKLKDSKSLTESEKLIWNYFEKIKGKKKFLDAASKTRLRFQLGQKDRMIQGIFFSGRYLEDFERIYREAGVPVELTRLPFVESSFNVLARSKVGASGLWQIMPYTMKAYSKKNPAVDLRNHPIEATKVSAKVLKSSYSLLKAWPLAVTGYNHGPSGVKRLTKKYKSRDLGYLVQNVSSRKTFGFASRNFYASFLAALEVERNATKYLGVVSWSQPLDHVDIKTTFPIKYSDLLRWFDHDDLKTQVFNPHITSLGRKPKAVLPKGTIVSVMKVRANQVMAELATPQAYKKAVAEATGKNPDQVLMEPVKHKVRKGETVHKIAKEYGVEVSQILKENKLKSGRKLRLGQTLVIPEN